MATYCTIAEIKNKLPEIEIINLSNDSGGSSNVNTTLVNAIISEQSDIIDDYLRAKYTLPLTATPTSIKNICIALCIYELVSRRDKRLLEDYEDTYKHAKERLNDIASGKMVLDTDKATIKTTFAPITTSTRTKVFTDDLLGTML